MYIRRDERGQVLVMAALSLTVVIGFAALATDVGVMLRQRRVAQTVADAAAIAAANESLYEGTPLSVTSGMYNAAYADTLLNGFTAGASNGQLNSSTGVTLTVNIAPNVSVSSFNSAGYVQATVSLNTQATLMKLFGFSFMNVGASAIASNTITSDGCFYVQNAGGYADPAVDMGGNSLINASNCGMTVNGNLVMGGNGTIDAKFVAVSGSISGKNAGNWSSGVPPQNDPLSTLQLTSNQPQASGGACTAPSGSGMNCVYNFGCDSGTCKANGCGSTTCTLKGATMPASGSTPTVYYYDKPINISGNVTGSQITFYLTGNTNYFDFANNGSGTFTPPGYGSSCVGSSNPLCGILFDAPTVGSANAGTYSCSTGKGNNGGNPGEIYLDFGSTTTTVEGIIYAPYMQLFGQDKGASTTFATDLIVGNVCIQSATFNVNSYSGAQSPITRVGLVY